MRWASVLLVGIACIESANAVEFEAPDLRGSVGPSYPIVQVMPPLAQADAALSAMLSPAREQPIAEVHAQSPTDVHAQTAAEAHASVLPPVWSWTGLYVGAHLGGALATTNFPDPFGPSIFGDKVRSPGFLAGAQVGYNWQPAGTPWVLGVEADISAVDADGTNTCSAFSAFFVSANCRVRPNALASLTGRIGYAAGPAGRTLLYLKGGAAWLNEDVNMTTNGGFVLPDASVGRTKWGWTVGAGVEQALTPAWSVKLEYDYLHFGDGNFTTPEGGVFIPGLGFFATAGAAASYAQNIHAVKLGLNYKFGADPWVPVTLPAPRFPVKAPVKAAPAVIEWFSGWQFEMAGRYVFGLGRFQKDLAPPSLVSRLTYDDMKTNAGEFVARIDSPDDFVLKGLVGVGTGKNGHMNDEDWGLGGALLAYSNTLSEPIDDSINYWTIDVGYNVLTGSGYRLTPFVGYNELRQNMQAFGCTPIAAGNCIPAVPASGSPVVTEDDTWQSVRLGLAGEIMLTPRVRLSVDAAYLPYVRFSGEDDHIAGNSGIVAEVFPESGTGSGVQLEGLLSYDVTHQFSVGIGARYWAMWTTKGHYGCSFGLVGTSCASATPGAQFPFKAAVEQTSVFLQAGYKFDAL
ncbi:MAG TPA: outer membrane beta-barrel protein [Pseudolabrys sp.]|nr:outer membrane beta-barrel protein [Pseudolabrys sp.]